VHTASVQLTIKYVNKTPAVGSPANRKLHCGEAFDMIQFVLAGDAVKDGAVIQMVDVDIRCERSSGPRHTDHSGFFEVWDVRGGVVVPSHVDFSAGIERYHDLFLLADPKIIGMNSKGTWSFAGWAIYVPGYDWHAGPDKWMTAFEPGHDPRAGFLPTRPLDDPPSAWTHIGAVGRVLKGMWNCFPGDAPQDTDISGSGKK
jgi:hypothetical protein